MCIHEAEGARAVDEIIVQGEHPLGREALAWALSAAGADLLSVAACDMHRDPVVSALTWVAASLDGVGRRAVLAAGIRTLTGIDPVHVFAIDEAGHWPLAAAAVRRRWPIVQRLDRAPEPLRSQQAGDSASGVWVLAAADAPEPSLVVMAVRPYAIRFTATELNRLAAIFDCRRRLARSRLALGLSEEPQPVASDERVAAAVARASAADIASR